uniref:P2X purinoreceptor 7 intracellular domain-containing protein n=1 Tax=Neogobius melanostomus TaxID=47308 RepID=A0A8C6WND0_9GOBI
MESDSDSSFATERSFEVEDFSPPSSPEVEVEEVNVEEEAGGPEPYMFEPRSPVRSALTSLPGHQCNMFIDGFLENVCCRETSKVGVNTCITEHPGFEAVALNPYVLQAVYGTYVQLFGEMPETLVHSNYRHIAYRNLVRWCWGYLGQHIRVVIPSCAVTRIRQEFRGCGLHRVPSCP